MMSVFRLFLEIIIKRAFLILGGVLISLVFIKQITKDFDPIWLSYIITGLIIIFFQASMMLRKNLNWILSLPISRMRILGLYYLLQIFIWILIGLISVIIFVSYYALFPSLSREGDQFFARQEIAQGEVGLILAMSGLFMFAFLHATCMPLMDGLTLTRVIKELWYTTQPQLRQFYRVSIVIIPLALLGTSQYLGTKGFDFQLLYSALLFFYSAISTAIMLKMSKKSRNQILGGSFVLWAVLNGGIYKIAVDGLSDPLSSKKAASILFLGPFADGISKSNLARTLESEMKAEEFSELSRYYLENFSQGRGIKKSQDRDLHFDVVLSAQKTERGLSLALQMFDPGELDYKDLKLFFEKWQMASSELIPSEDLYFLMRANSTKAELAEFLQSNNDSALLYGLVRSRYERDPLFISAIENNIVKYKDELRLSALKTLSILYGRYVGLEDWVEYKSGRGLASQSMPFNTLCNMFRVTQIQEINETNISALNQCIRQKMSRRNIELMSQLDRLGWISLPLDTQKKRIIQRAFHLPLLPSK